MTTEALKELIIDYQLGMREDTPCPLKGVVGGNNRVEMRKRIQDQSTANLQYLNFIPILIFHFTLRSMTTEALRKLIKDYQLGLRVFYPLPPEGGCRWKWEDGGGEEDPGSEYG
jgi:hypothetical protein